MLTGMKNKKRVILGFSGGVDSAAAAVLLAQQGFQVIPVALDMGGPGRDFLLERAAKMADRLGLELLVEPVADIFNEKVVEYLLSSYNRAQTPNPCIRCNASVKFAGLVAVAERLQVEKIATGHYFFKGRDGVFYKAFDKHKDQSYFLFSVAHDILQRSLFPLGEIDKKTATALAASAGYELENYRESQELCFLNGEKYQEFMQGRGEVGEPGEIVDLNGKVLGEHTGLQNYTVGQRKGMGIAHPVPLYVVRLDYQNNRLLVGERESVYSAKLKVREINWLVDMPVKDQNIECQIRYNHQPAPATLQVLADDLLAIEFATPQFAITPGQGAAFFQDEQLLGGGFICSD
jgi:tRNA-specific 2-thiouridylase